MVDIQSKLSVAHNITLNSVVCLHYGIITAQHTTFESDKSELDHPCFNQISQSLESINEVVTVDTLLITFGFKMNFPVVLMVFVSDMLAFFR